MSDQSDALIGLLLGIFGGALAIYLLIKLFLPTSKCPICGVTVKKGQSNTSTCPNCGSQLRWD
jgi:rubrerythrin